jgi:hypothetical protein
MDSGLGAARGSSLGLIDGGVGMDCFVGSNEKPKSPIRGIVGTFGSVIGPVIGLNVAAAASAFAVWVVSVWVGRAVTTETSGVFLIVAIPAIAAMPKKIAPIRPNSLR